MGGNIEMNLKTKKYNLNVKSSILNIVWDFSGLKLKKNNFNNNVKTLKDGIKPYN